MSFGYGVGDFLTVGQLCWKIYKKCKDSPGNYAELSSEVGALHNVIKETEELLSQQGLTTAQEVKLRAYRQGCEDVLSDLDGLLVRYDSLGTNSRRTFDRMGFGMQDMNGIRLRLIANVSTLDAFNNASSNARLENKLNLLIAEVRAGKREGSVVSTKTFDTAAQNDRETWEALRRELEDIGISPIIITEKRQFIIAWFREAVAAGKLVEDAPSDDDDSTIFLEEPDSPASESKGLNALDNEMSSTTMVSRPIEQRTVKGSVPKPQHPSGQPAEAVRSMTPPPPKSRKRGSYLLNKLRGRDKQFLAAAKAGDVPTMDRLLEKGVDIQARGLQGYKTDSALHLAARSGKQEAVRLLLFKGADVDAETWFCHTALHLAAVSGKEPIVRLLLEKGADLESKDLHCSTALISAARAGHEAVVRLLLEKEVHVNAEDSGGYTALMKAASYGHVTVVRLLLEKGADLKSKDVFGYTALMSAVSEGHGEVVRLLLKKSADLDSQNNLHDGRALTHAARKGHVAVMQLLLEKEVDVDSQ